MQTKILSDVLNKNLEKEESPPNKKDFEIFTRSILIHRDFIEDGAKRLTKDSHEAKDLFQETYLKAWCAREKYQERNTTRQWLFRIMYNLFVNKYHQKKKAPKFTNQDFSIIENRLNTSDKKNLEGALLKEDLLEGIKDSLSDDVYLLLKSLPTQYQSLLISCCAYGKSYKDTASDFGIKLGTVRSRISRGKAIFKRKYNSRKLGLIQN